MRSQQLARRLGAAGIAVVALLATSYFAVLGATSAWPTYQHEAARSGLDPDAAPITTLSAGWSTQLDEKMYAQPLVAGNLVYAATEASSVYALDATTGAIVWRQHLSTPLTSGLPCGNINPIGITSTPVIDTANNVLYTVALQGGPIHHELYALNLSAGGAVLYHYPIDGPGSDPTAQGQRGALTLANNKVYVPYAGRSGDCGNYNGRVVAANTGDASGASRVNYVLPNTSRGGIWAAGSADSSGNVYFASGNSNATGSTADRGESVIKLSPSLQEMDFFTAPEWSNLNASDTDIGSIGPILLQNGWILQSGKNGMGYLLNSSTLGHVGGQLFEARVCDPGQEALAFGAYLAASNTVFIPCSTALKAVHVSTSGPPSFTVTTVRSGYGGDPGSSPPIIAGGVLWNLDSGSRLLLGFNPSTGQQLFSQPLAGTPVHFVAPSSGAGHIFVPSGSILEGFRTIIGGPTPTSTVVSTVTPTSTVASTMTPTSTVASTVTPTSTVASTATSTPTIAAMSTSTATPQAHATYTSQASGSSNPVMRGATFTVKSTVTSSQSVNALIDVEIYDPAFNKVFQQFWDNQALVAGQSAVFTSQWQVPSTITTGTYTTMIGVFPPGWGAPMDFNRSALTFSVAAAAVPTQTSTPKPTNTPVPTSTATPLPTSTSTPLPTSTVAPTSTQVPAQPTFTSSASVSAPAVHPGGTVQITAAVKSSTSLNALVDLEVYDPSFNKVFQQFWDNLPFMAGQTLTRTGTWSVPTTAPTGTYLIMVGEFSPGWGTLYNWNANAATISVN